MKASLWHLVIVLCLLSIRLSGNEPIQPTEQNVQEQLTRMLETDNHLGIIALIDSLRNAGEYTPELSWQYARSLFQSARYDQAKDSLQKFEMDPMRSTQAKNMLVTIAIQQRREMEAVRHLIQLRDRYPENPVYPHRLARVFVSINQLPAAEGQLALANRLDTLNQAVIAEWAEVLLKMDAARRALGILERGLRISPENIGFRRQKAVIDFRLQRYDQVIRNVGFLTEKGDTTPQIVKILAFSYFHTGVLDKSEQWIAYLLDNEFTGEDIFYYKARILSAKGEKEAAQDYYRLAVHYCLSPNFDNFVFQAGLNLHDTRRFPEAIRWFQMARMFSANPLIAFYLAESYYQYYEDRSPALALYQLFLEQSESEQEEELRFIARSRMAQIREDQHCN